jgi:hypothetical protein
MTLLPQGKHSCRLFEGDLVVAVGKTVAFQTLVLSMFDNACSHAQQYLRQFLQKTSQKQCFRVLFILQFAAFVLFIVSMVSWQHECTQSFKPVRGAGT